MHQLAKQSTRKEEKIKSKPWITKGIETSISIRDKLYNDKEISKRKMYIYTNKSPKTWIFKKSTETK